MSKILQSKEYIDRIEGAPVRMRNADGEPLTFREAQMSLLREVQEANPAHDFDFDRGTVQDWGDAVLKNEDLAEQYFKTILRKVTKSQLIDNYAPHTQYGVFMAGTIYSGAAAEEIIDVGPVDSYTASPDHATADAHLRRYDPHVQSQILTRLIDKWAGVTVERRLLREGFATPEGFNQLIAALHGTLTKSKQEVLNTRVEATLITNSVAYNKTLVDLGETPTKEQLEELIIMIDQMAVESRFSSNLRNPAGVWTAGENPEDIVVLVRSDLLPRIRTKVYANQNHPNFAALPYENFIPVKEFTNVGIVAMVMNKNALRVRDYLDPEEDTVKNILGGYVNFFLTYAFTMNLIPYYDGHVIVDSSYSKENIDEWYENFKEIHAEKSGYVRGAENKEIAKQRMMDEFDSEVFGKDPNERSSHFSEQFEYKEPEPAGGSLAPEVKSETKKEAEPAKSTKKTKDAKSDEK